MYMWLTVVFCSLLVFYFSIYYNVISYNIYSQKLLHGGAATSLHRLSSRKLTYIYTCIIYYIHLFYKCSLRIFTRKYNRIDDNSSHTLMNYIMLYTVVGSNVHWCPYNRIYIIYTTTTIIIESIMIPYNRIVLYYNLFILMYTNKMHTHTYTQRERETEKRPHAISAHCTRFQYCATDKRDKRTIFRQGLRKS